MAEPDRTRDYRKEPAHEDALARFNQLLSALPFDLDPGALPSSPVVFLVGTQRSGSTVLMQLLARAFSFTYPDNLVARLWSRPELGVLLSACLRRQAGEGWRALPLESDYGVSAATFEPHEFGYFWTRHFDLAKTHELSDAEFAQADSAAFLRDLAGMERHGWGPLLFKAVAMSMNAAALAELVPGSLFLHLTRDPLYVAQSTYLARQNRYGDSNAWWSLKPRGYDALLGLPPEEQVAEQVLRCGRVIAQQLAQIDPTRVWEVSYEQLCAQPNAVLTELAEWLPAERVPGYSPPERLANGNTPKLAEPLLETLRRVLGTEEG